MSHVKVNNFKATCDQFERAAEKLGLEENLIWTGPGRTYPP